MTQRGDGFRFVTLGDEVPVLARTASEYAALAALARAYHAIEIVCAESDEKLLAPHIPVRVLKRGGPPRGALWLRTA